MNIFNQPIDFLERDKHGGYICPSCGSGSGKNGTGLSLNINAANYEEHPCWKCWSCGFYGDVINLYAIRFGYSDQREAFRAYRKYIGMEHEYTKVESRGEVQTKEKNGGQTENISYLEYFTQTEQTLDPTYLQSRGISEEIQRYFHIGTDLSWVHPKVKNSTPTKRCIIPRTEHSYLARAIDNDDNGIPKQSCGPTGFFNANSLTRENAIVFVTEGEIDAMSIAEILKENYLNWFEQGRVDVLALCTAAKWKAAVEQINANSSTVYILALDSDNTGKNSSEKMGQALQDKEVLYLVASDLPNHAKDANEALCNNREVLNNWCAENIQHAMSLQQESICYLVERRELTTNQLSTLENAMVCVLPETERDVVRLLDSLPAELKLIYIKNPQHYDDTSKMIEKVLRKKHYEIKPINQI